MVGAYPPGKIIVLFRGVPYVGETAEEIEQIIESLGVSMVFLGACFPRSTWWEMAQPCARTKNEQTILHTGGVRWS